MLFDTAPHSDFTQLLRFTGSPPFLPRPIPRHLHSHRWFFRLEPTPLRSSKRTHQRRPRPGAPSPRFSLSTSSSSASNQLKWDVQRFASASSLCSLSMCVRTITYCSLAFINRSILQWSAMCGLGGNTTRVSRADENLINLFLCSGNYSRKIQWSIICGLIPTRKPPPILTYQHLVHMFSL